MSDDVLDLVQQYGDLRALFAIQLPERSAEENAAAEREHRALFDRIAALLPQQPVQARSMSGALWWIHGCGEVDASEARPEPDHCGKAEPDSWRPLLVGGTPAPERCTTLSQSGWRCPLPAGHEELHTINYDEPPADLRRFEAANGHPYERPFQAEQPDLMAQVMAELGVDRTEDVLPYIRREWKLHKEASERFADLREQRDRIRAEVDRLLEINRSKQGRIAELQAEVERLKAAGALTPEDARRAYDAWRAAMAAPTDSLVLSLPTVPEGAVALVGVESGTRYTSSQAAADEGCWYSTKTFTWYDHIGEVLGIEGSVRVEMAPPREQRTAAEIWRSMRSGQEGQASIPAELAEALDREAGTGDGSLTEVFDDKPGGDR